LRRATAEGDVAIYFAAKLDEHEQQKERERRAEVEIDLAWRFATGRNMFGSGNRPSPHWRSSAAPYETPTTIGFRLNNIVQISCSKALSTFARAVRAIFGRR
jgi:hypothetical protein